MKNKSTVKKAKKESKKYPLDLEGMLNKILKKSFLSQKFEKFLPSFTKRKKTYIGGGILIISSFLANVLNYIFNAYLGRILSFDDFSLIGLIGGFLSVASIFFGALSLTVNYRSSFLIGKYDDAAAYHFWEYIRKQTRYPSLALTIIWLLLTPTLMQFFDTDNMYLFILFGLVLLASFTTYINQGFLSAKMMFRSLSVMSLSDPLLKLLFTFLLVYLGLKTWTFSAIPFSAVIVLLITWLLITKQLPKNKTKAPQSEVQYFPKKFFLVSVLSGLSSIAYFSFDIFLAKHFLTPTDAGRYTLVTLVGKMIFFLGRLTVPFIVPLVGRREGAQKNSLSTLYILTAFTGLFSFVGFILFGIFGSFTVPILYGEKALSIVSYLSFYTFGMFCYTISSVMASYYLVRKFYTFTIAPFFLIFLELGLLLLFHDSVKTITLVMTFMLIVNLLLTIVLHFGINYVSAFERKISKITRSSSTVEVTQKIKV